MEVGDLKSDSEVVSIGKTFLTSGSIMFDAVYVPGGAKSVSALSKDADVVQFLNEAFKHHKSIACAEDAGGLLKVCAFKASDVLVGSKLKEFVASLPLHRDWSRSVSFIPA